MSKVQLILSSDKGLPLGEWLRRLVSDKRAERNSAGKVLQDKGAVAVLM